MALALLALVACDRQSEPEPLIDSSAQPIDQFFTEVFERRVVQSPVRQSQLGRQTQMLGDWDDVSDEFAALQLEESRQYLARLRKNYATAQLSDTEQLSYELFEFNTERSIANTEFRRHSYVVDQFNGQLSGLITVLQNNHPVNDVEDAENYVSRIAGLQQVLEEMSRQLEDRAAFGVIAPAFSFPDVLTDARGISSGAPIDEGEHDNAVFVDFRKKVSNLDISDEEKAQLLQGASEALRGPFAAGFATLITELERQQPLASGNRGVWSLPDGLAFYQNRIEHHTTLNLTAQEIHSIGLSEVARIQSEMRGIMEQVGFEHSLRDFFDFIREDPRNYYENSDAGRADFLNEAARRTDAIYEVVGDYFNELPKAKLEVRRVEPWRENSTSIAFYNRPSEDGSRPGVYYANLADMTSVQRYVFSAITYHESVPGHHFQLALSQEIADLPAFRRYGGYGAYVEGWALYAEQLAGEMGFYETPYHDFGRLQNELWRAVRLVLDTGMHASKWTREQSIDYFRENTPLSEGDIVTEVERFFVNPGQALGYKLGMIKILELRERARAQLGSDFDIREFHHAVIGAGALPLPLLERQVERYISTTKAAVL